MFAGVLLLTTMVLSELTVEECLLTWQISEANSAEESELQSRFPNEVEIASKYHQAGMRPSRYDISVFVITPDSLIVDAEVTMVAVEPVDRIYLHTATNHRIDVSLIRFKGNKFNVRPCVKRVARSLKLQRMVVYLDRLMEIGSSLTFRFNVWNLKPKSATETTTYSNDTASNGIRLDWRGQDVWALHTLFQRTWARTAFPCFDHPLLKSRFRVRLGATLPDVLLLSNTAETDSWTVAANNSDTGTMEFWREFELTPVLPTYLLSFSILRGFVRRADAQEHDQTLVEVFHGISSPDIYDWILPLARRSLMQMQNLTGMPYDLPKLSFIMVTTMPGIGGLENHGLVTLIDNLRTSINNKPVANNTVVHEVIHLWIGNRLTVSVWNELCLQEGLTSYLTQLLYETEAYVEHIMRSEVCSKQQLLYLGDDQIFISQCYNKAKVIFQMIADHIGQERFTAYIRALLDNPESVQANFSYWTQRLISVTDDGDTMKAMMHQWWFKQGYPILYIKKSNQAGNTLTIKQRLFIGCFPRPVINQQRTFSVEILTLGGQRLRVLINRMNLQISLNSSSDSLYLFDPEMRNMARYVYDVDNYHRLLDCDLSPDSAGFCKKLHYRYTSRMFADLCWTLQYKEFPWMNPFDCCEWLRLVDRLEEKMVPYNLQKCLLRQDRFNQTRVCECEKSEAISYLRIGQGNFAFSWYRQNEICFVSFVAIIVLRIFG